MIGSTTDLSEEEITLENIQNTYGNNQFYAE